MGSIYIIDISIYLDLPARGTDKQMYRLSIKRIIIIYMRGRERRERKTKRERERQIDRQTDRWTIERQI